MFSSTVIKKDKRLEFTVLHSLMCSVTPGVRCSVALLHEILARGWQMQDLEDWYQLAVPISALPFSMYKA